MSADSYPRFGRYLLAAPLAQGGMAEIHLAIQLSDTLGGRVVALKRIQASISKDEHFAKMFQSEARLAMRVNHPGIAQSYDFGQADGQSFIAMEYVSGVSLTEILKKLDKSKASIPIAHAVSIAIEAAGALHYAHALADLVSGLPLGIVHRDISPQNILISYEGQVKVIDFGVAKAATNIEKTRTGLIKGKPGYLSPEQIEGKELDGRSDVFALGTVLWEALTMRRLFAGKDDFSTFRKIVMEDAPPPSSINPAIPPSLDSVLLKALARDRDRRFSDAKEFQRALRGCLDSISPEPIFPRDLSKWVLSSFREEQAQESARLQEVHRRIAALAKPQGEAASGFANEKTLVTHVEIEASPSLGTPKPASPGARTPAPVSFRNRPQPRTPEQRGSFMPFVLLATVAGAGVWGWRAYSSREPQEVPHLSVAPSKAPVVLEKLEPGMIRLRLTWPARFSPEIIVNGKVLPAGRDSWVVPLSKPIVIEAHGGGIRPYRHQFVLPEQNLKGLEDWLEQLEFQPE